MGALTGSGRVPGLAKKPAFGSDRRQRQAEFFLIERRRGKAHIYRRLVLLASLVAALLAAL